jgi:hypothetical protein
MQPECLSCVARSPAITALTWLLLFAQAQNEIWDYQFGMCPPEGSDGLLEIYGVGQRNCAAIDMAYACGSGAWTRTRITSSKGWRATDCTTPEQRKGNEKVRIAGFCAATKGESRASTSCGRVICAGSLAHSPRPAAIDSLTLELSDVFCYPVCAVSGEAPS